MWRLRCRRCSEAVGKSIQGRFVVGGVGEAELDRPLAGEYLGQFR